MTKTARQALAAALAVVCISAQAVEQDKVKHAAVSAVFGAIAGASMDSKAAAFGIAMVPGLLKEIHDSRKDGSGFSGRDLAADAIGAALGVYVGNCVIRGRSLTCSFSF